MKNASSPILKIPPSPYFYQFLLLLIFINSSSSLFLSIPPSLYFYQFLLLLIFINSSSSLFLSIPPSPYFYQFLHLLIFINSSSSLFLSIPPSLYFYQFLLLLIFINSFSSPNFSFVFYYEKQISICFERKINRLCKCSLRSVERITIDRVCSSTHGFFHVFHLDHGVMPVLPNFLQFLGAKRDKDTLVNRGIAPIYGPGLLKRSKVAKAEVETGFQGGTVFGMANLRPYVGTTRTYLSPLLSVHLPPFNYLYSFATVAARSPEIPWKSNLAPPTSAHIIPAGESCSVNISRLLTPSNKTSPTPDRGGE